MAHARSILAFQLNPTLEPAAALTAIDAQIEQAYYKTKIATAAQGAADLLRQNIMINLVQDSRSLAGQKLNDPAALMIATARANATASVNSAFLTMGKIAEQALPLVRNVIKPSSTRCSRSCSCCSCWHRAAASRWPSKSFAMSLVWIQLWPRSTPSSTTSPRWPAPKEPRSRSKMGTVAQGLALETAASIYSGAVSDQAIAGYMVISIPIIATAIIKGGEVAFQAVTGVGAVQSAASGEAAATSKGQHHPERGLDGSAAAGSHTIVRLHVDDQRRLRHHHPGQRPRCRRLPLPGQPEPAGQHLHLHRTASRTPWAKAHAKPRRWPHRARGHAAQPGHRADPSAFGIQESYERSQQRSGAEHIRRRLDQHAIQTLNSVARDVNRRLGLSDDSTVGKTVTAAASIGAKIPADRDRRRREGRKAGRSISRPCRAPTTSHAGRRKRAAHGGERSDQGLPFLRAYQ